MINKVLIAEDHESSNISLQRVLDEMGVPQTDYTFYCDDALAAIRNALSREQSYDLLITDLYFEEDGTTQVLKNGGELIMAARKLQPELKVLVFSAENKTQLIDQLYRELEVDGFVRKARNDAKELRMAISCIEKNHRYLPRHLKRKNAFEFSSFDIAILRLLSEGVRQKDIPDHLQRQDIRPCGLSSVEKRLSLLKEEHSCYNNEQLIAYCKDKGII